MPASELESRLRIAPNAMPAVLAIAVTEFKPETKVVLRDGDVWLTELHVYGAVNALKRRGPQGRLRRVADDVLRQCIEAFVDERRKPPQTPENVNGEPSYACVTPGSDDMFRPHPDGGHDLNEVGAIFTAIEALNTGDTSISPSEALRNMVEVFDKMQADRQRLAKWTPIGGNGPSHLA
jgi:hypothetical protein